MRAVAAAFAAAGLSREDAAYNTALYFKNADHGTLPFLHLDALLTAALVWQFATGRSNTLNKGTTNDLAAIKYFLPYCDAMYVDNAMRALLADHQVARELRFGARVFSRKTCDEFVAYLEELIVSAPVEHIAKIREVYGEKRGEPFTSMYEPRRKETS